MSAEAATDPNVPKRVAGVVGLASLAIGIVIGSGIFKVPGEVFAAAGENPSIALGFWVVGGLFALTGALTTAELAAMFPRQGGTFVYVNEAYGKYWAFAVGWCSRLVGYPAACAAIAHVFGEYTAVAVGADFPSQSGGLGYSAFLLMGCAIFNNFGTRFSFGMQSLLAILKVGLVMCFAAVLLVGAAEPATAEVVPTSPMVWDFGVIAAGLIAVYWTYDGWQNLVVVAGEAKAPERTLLRSLVGSLLLVIVLYLIINFGLTRALAPEVLSGHETPGAEAAKVAFGVVGERVLSGLVALSTGTAVFGLFVAAPRFIYAIGKAGFFFQAVSRLHRETQAPQVGNFVILMMASVYLLTSSFGQTLAVYAFVGLSVEFLAVTALFTLRFRRPDADRPVRVPLYPVVPLIYAAVCLILVVGAVVGAPLHCLAGAGIMALTLPVYWVWNRWGGRR